MHLLAQRKIKNTSGHIAPFIGIGWAALYFYFCPRVIGRPHRFFQFRLVVLDDRIGCIDNVFCRAIILLQTIHGDLFVIFLKIQNVVDIGSTKSINALCIVAHNTNVLKLIRECTNNQVLRMIGVLVLVDQDISKTVLVFGQHIRESIEQFVGSQKKIVKIHGSRFETPVYVLCINFTHFGALCHGIGFLQIGVVVIGPHRNQTVFERRNTAAYLLGFILIFVESHFFDDRGQQTVAVLGVVDGEVGWISKLIGFGTKNACKNGVKCTHPQILGFAFTHQLCDAFFHFARRFVGKRQCQNRKSVHALSHQIRNTVSQHPGFPRTGPCDNDQWTVLMQGRRALRFI